MSYQFFWKCAHHTSALENFSEKRETCEWDCHLTSLRWYHNGTHPMPKSWGGAPTHRVSVRVPFQYKSNFSAG